MSREVPWISKPTDEIQQILSNTEHSGLLVLQKVGPLSFVLGDENGKKYKTALGSVNTCSCQKRFGDYCIHIAFVICKVFRLPTSNPLCWQKGFIDRELTQIMKNTLITIQHNSSTSASSSLKSPDSPATVEQRPIGPDSICAICQEEMNINQGLAYCRFGCGNSVHIRCLGHWAQHSKSIGAPVTCPFCRAEWGPIETVRRGLQNCPFVHSRVKCEICGMAPLVGPRLRCLICSDYNLCVECYKDGGHPDHSFQCYDTNSSPPRIIDTTEENKLYLERRQKEKEAYQKRIRELASLQLREITSDDYALLLELDNHTTTVRTRKFPMSQKLLTYIFSASSLPSTNSSSVSSSISSSEPTDEELPQHLESETSTQVSAEENTYLNSKEEEIASPSQSSSSQSDDLSAMLHYRVDDDTTSSSSPTPTSSVICPICSNKIEVETGEANTIRSLQCGHCFHSHCIDPFLLKSDVCPIDHRQCVDYNTLVDVENVIKEKHNKLTHRRLNNSHEPSPVNESFSLQPIHLHSDSRIQSTSTKQKASIIRTNSIHRVIPRSIVNPFQEGPMNFESAFSVKRFTDGGSINERDNTSPSLSSHTVQKNTNNSYTTINKRSTSASKSFALPHLPHIERTSSYPNKNNILSSNNLSSLVINGTDKHNSFQSKPQPQHRSRSAERAILKTGLPYNSQLTKYTSELAPFSPQPSHIPTKDNYHPRALSSGRIQKRPIHHSTSSFASPINIRPPKDSNRLTSSDIRTDLDLIADSFFAVSPILTDNPSEYETSHHIQVPQSHLSFVTAHKTNKPISSRHAPILSASSHQTNVPLKQQSFNTHSLVVGNDAEACSSEINNRSQYKGKLIKGPVSHPSTKPRSSLSHDACVSPLNAQSIHSLSPRSSLQITQNS